MYSSHRALTISTMVWVPPYMLTTWLGPSDLRTMSTVSIQREILGITHQDGPYDLLAPSFNLTSCRMDSTAIYGELKSLVVTWHPIPSIKRCLWS